MMHPAEDISDDIASSPSDQSSELIQVPLQQEQQFKMSTRTAPVLAVTNFFFIIYLILMIIIATVIAEIKSPQLISVSQMQSWSIPFYDRFVEVFSIICAAVLVAVLCGGIALTSIEMPEKTTLRFAWAHLISLCGSCLVQFIITVMYLVSLEDVSMTAFFITVFVLFVGASAFCAALHVYMLDKENKARQFKQEQAPIELLTENPSELSQC
jgi:uncharacterized protein YacL